MRLGYTVQLGCLLNEKHIKYVPDDFPCTSPHAEMYVHQVGWYLVYFLTMVSRALTSNSKPHMDAIVTLFLVFNFF